MRSRRMLRRAAIALTAAWALLFRVGMAFAQYPGGQETPPQVAGERFFRGREGVARTGLDVLLLILIALLALLIGYLIHRSSRNARPSDG